MCSQKILVAQDDTVYVLEPVPDVIVKAFIRAWRAGVHTKPRDIDLLPGLLGNRKSKVFPFLGAGLQPRFYLIN